MRSMKMVLAMALAMTVAACGDANGDLPANAANSVEPADSANMAVNVAAAPDKPGPVAAAAVVQAYAALAEQRDFAAAAEHWTDAGNAAQFAADLDDYPKVAMTVGKAGDVEGAAGSLFVKVPLALKLTLRSGSPYEMTCAARLRRVNDVPGATAKQLRWNIEAIDC